MSLNKDVQYRVRHYIVSLGAYCNRSFTFEADFIVKKPVEIRDGDGSLSVLSRRLVDDTATEAAASARMNNTSSQNTTVQKREDGLLIAPNPTNDRFFINMAKNIGNTGTIHIYNMQGQVVFTEQLDNLDNQKEINCQTWNSGLYIVELKSDKDTYIQKVMVRH